MRVAITGASGFIGRALVEALAGRGYQIRAGVRRAVVLPPGIDVVRHPDLSGPALDWRAVVAGADAVVHLAGIAHERVPPHLHDHVNHVQTAALADAARQAGVARFVLVSSVRAQSGPAADRPLTEGDEPRPTDAYGRSKLAAERAVRASGIPHVILRPALVHGPGVKGNLAMLRRLAALPVPLPFGALRNRRSLCSLDGLIQAIELALVHPVVDACFVVADAAPITVRDLMAALRPRGLISLPPAVLALGLRTIGRRDLWDRLGGELVVDPSRLIGLGWRARDTATELTRIVTRSG